MSVRWLPACSARITAGSPPSASRFPAANPSESRDWNRSSAPRKQGLEVKTCYRCTKVFTIGPGSSQARIMRRADQHYKAGRLAWYPPFLTCGFSLPLSRNAHLPAPRFGREQRIRRISPHIETRKEAGGFALHPRKEGRKRNASRRSILPRMH
jgi:hypothetical protein